MCGGRRARALVSYTASSKRRRRAEEGERDDERYVGNVLVVEVLLDEVRPARAGDFWGSKVDAVVNASRGSRGGLAHGVSRFVGDQARPPLGYLARFSPRQEGRRAKVSRESTPSSGFLYHTFLYSAAKFVSASVANKLQGYKIRRDACTSLRKGFRKAKTSVFTPLVRVSGNNSRPSTASIRWTSSSVSFTASRACRGPGAPPTSPSTVTSTVPKRRLS